MSDEETNTGEAPVATQRSPERFWRSTEGTDALSDPRPFGQENALQKLGRPPFEKSTRSKFRVLGYLATVYEHVARDVGERLGEGPGAGDASGDQAGDEAAAGNAAP